jgi:dienelactone hydrolase
MRANENDEHLVRLVSREGTLEGNLVVPDEATGIVLFAHGSGSSRLSPRNRYVARVLQEAGLATLLLDLLMPMEEAIDERTAQLRFDIPFLARRLVSATDWLVNQPATHHLQIGYFGASTGAAAALVAAAERPEVVGAIVSRGGRPDLAHAALPRVQAPTLLIVGGNDPLVLELNREALDQLATIKRLAIVPGATHLFEEPGALEQVAHLAREWFSHYLVSAGHEMLPQPAAPS